MILQAIPLLCPFRISDMILEELHKVFLLPEEYAAPIECPSSNTKELKLLYKLVHTRWVISTLYLQKS